MNSQELRNLQEAYMKVVMGEGKVAWDDKKNPNPSGLTPKEKSDAKRKQLGVDNPDNSSFEKGGPGEKEYARHGNLAAAQDKMSKRSTQPKGKPHEFKKSYVGKRTKGQYNRLFGAKVPKDKRSSYEPEKKDKNSPSFSLENCDVYDIILSHLLDEGYAETQEQAEVIMVNMSEEWRESIFENVSSGKGRVTRYVQSKPTGPVTNRELDVSRQKRMDAENDRIKKIGDEAHAAATSKGLSFAEAEFRRKRAELRARKNS